MTKAQIKGLQQFAENIVVAGLVAGLTAIAPYIQGTGTIDWQTVLHVFAIASIFAVLNAISTGIKAINPTLGTIMESDVQAAQTRLSADGGAGPVQGPLVTIHTATGAGAGAGAGANDITAQQTAPVIPAISISNVSPLQSAFSNPTLPVTSASPKS